MQLDVPAADPAAAEAAARRRRRRERAQPVLADRQTAQAAASAAARVVLSTNLATAHILAGDLPSASAAVRQALALQPDNRHALLCRVYLDLRQNVEAARADPPRPASAGVALLAVTPAPPRAAIAEAAARA